MKSDLHETHKQHAFDSYCKRVLKNEAANGHREINRRARMEISISALSEEAFEQLAVCDCYPWEHTSFAVGNDTVVIKDDRLAEALERMPEDARNIVLMYWLLGMSDREIGAYLNVPRRSAKRYRQASYRMLKKLMGGKADE